MQVERILEAARAKGITLSDREAQTYSTALVEWASTDYDVPIRDEVYETVVEFKSRLGVLTVRDLSRPVSVTHWTEQQNAAHRTAVLNELKSRFPGLTVAQVVKLAQKLQDAKVLRPTGELRRTEGLRGFVKRTGLTFEQIEAMTPDALKAYA